jgi:hypothetical protein
VSAAGRICRRAGTRAGAAERAGSAFLFFRKRIGAAGLPAERAQDGADAAAPSGITAVLHPGNRWAASGTRTTMLATSLVALSPLTEALGNMKRAT